jgi:hypothetical protein
VLVVSVTGRAWNGPKYWSVEDEGDERLVLHWLARLDDFAADRDAAYLLAADDEQSIGAWSKEGARQLSRELDAAGSPGLQQIRRELRQAVSSG